jgi:predicted MPP superfamily phosphohydrolase
MPDTARLLTGTAAAVAAAGAACVAYGVLVERHWYRLRSETVPVLAEGDEPLTLVHLSDLHMVADDQRQQAFLAELAERPADLVVVTGDMLGEPESLEAVLATLGKFQPAIGAVAVLGSNDYYAPRPKNWLGYFRRDRGRRKVVGRNPWPELVAGLEGFGWSVLSNDRTRLGDIDVAGMDDAHIFREELATAVPADGSSRLRLGVAHSPYRRVLDAYERNGYQLVLCGHTHGGQVRLPGVGALVTNCDLPADRARGLSRWRSSWVHVSAGLGVSKYAPFRFACRPEASILTLVASGSSD